jgi:hypothetical protein
MPDEVKNILQWLALAVVAVAFQFAPDGVLIFFARFTLAAYALVFVWIAFLQLKFWLERE